MLWSTLPKSEIPQVALLSRFNKTLVGYKKCPNIITIKYSIWDLGSTTTTGPFDLAPPERPRFLCAFVKRQKPTLPWSYLYQGVPFINHSLIVIPHVHTVPYLLRVT